MLALGALCLGGFDRAAAIEVTRSADDMGGGTLREAIAAANGTTGPDTITFAPGLNGGTIDLDEGVLQITDTTGKITIDASSLADGVTLGGDTNDRDRVFLVNLATELELINVVISGGRAPHGNNGIDGATADDGEDGGNGGGIYNLGTLTLQNCEVFFNKAGNGGNAGELDADAGFAGVGGIGGLGGGIYSDGEDAAVTLIDSVVTFNLAGDGGEGGGVATGRTGNAGVGGQGGSGGGIYCIRGNLTLIRSLIDGNEAGDGGAGGYDGDGDPGKRGGAGGDGGGIALIEVDPDIQDSEIVGNYAGNGGIGGKVSLASSDIQGPGGDGGQGGGLFALVFELAARAQIVNSLIYANNAGNGAMGGSADGLGSGDGTDGGFGGFGGGVYVTSQSSTNDPIFRVENSTFYQNSAGNGGGGGPGSATGTGGTGGDAGSGGGLAFEEISTYYTALLSHVTVVSNEGGLEGAGDSGTGGFDGFESEGGGIWTSLPSGLTLANSLVTSNTAVSTANVGAFTGEGANFTSGLPVLQSELTDNGGSTRSLSPLLGSPLIDGGGDISNPLASDQRGEGRPKNAAPDLGAVEVSILVDAKIGLKSNPASQKVDNYYTASGAGQVQRISLSGLRKSKFYFSVQNDGDIADELVLVGSKGNKTLKLKAFQLTGARVNVTGAMRAGYLIGVADPGVTTVFQAQVKARSSKKKARQTLFFRGQSTSALAKDAVKAKVKQAKK